jgi:defect-in-organelle-trafficking protein DotC
MGKRFANRLLTLAIVTSAVVALGSTFAFASSLPERALELQKKKAPEVYESGVFNELRPQAIKEAAQTLAIQEAVKYRYGNIVNLLNQNTDLLDNIFAFNSLMLNDKVIPPIIGRADASFKVESDTMAKSTDVVYRILAPAKIAATPPNWRDYLLYSFDAIEDVNPSLLPENAIERKIWEEGIEQGWQIGIAQADRVYSANLNRLVRDFKGMLRFNLLAAQKMVSVPVLAEGTLGVQVGDQILDVNQKIFRITAPTVFTRVEEWKPIFASQK